MNEEMNKNSESQQTNVPDNTDYIEALREMRNSTVSREQYNKLKEENKKLLNSLVNGEVISADMKPAEVDIDQLRKDLYSDNRPDLNNLDYITKTLELRQAIMDKGGLDPFVPVGHKVSPTANDFEAAERVANVLQECVEEANGDSQTFTAALQRRII